MRANIICAVITLASATGAAAAPSPGKAAPIIWDSKVMVARVGEASTVNIAELSFGEEWGRDWESWITVADLPAAYRAKPVLNDSFLAVEANRQGKPTGCTALRPSAEPALDTLGCRLLVERAGFRPLYGGPGQTIAARWVVAVRWKTAERAFTAPPFVAMRHDATPPRLTDHAGWPRLDWHDLVLFENVPDAQAAYRAPVRGPKAGRTSLDLITDPQAGITGCEIGQSSGSAELDEAACALARQIRLRYRQPCEICSPDRIPLQVVWSPEGSRIRLPLASPSRYPKPSAALPTYVSKRRRIAGDVAMADFKGIRDLTVKGDEVYTRLAVDAAGKPTACKVTYSSGNAAVDARTCALMLKRLRYTIRTDVFGDPAADVVAGWMGLWKKR